jgi:hypothetical protein
VQEGNISETGIPLSATQSGATIFGGTDDYSDPATWPANSNIDNPQLVLFDHTREYLVTTLLGSTDWQQVNTSVDPVLLNAQDLDLCGGRQRGISNKLFTHLGYTWNDHCGWTPFFGVGGEVEWGYRNHNPECITSCHSSCHQTHATCNGSCCQDFALSQWGVWVKGGVSFN